jgi:hypothetical protein
MHPYWWRTLIIQEIAKARKVHILYSGWYMSWDSFSATVHDLILMLGIKVLSQEVLFFEKDVQAVTAGVMQINFISDVRRPVVVESFSLLRSLLHILEDVWPPIFEIKSSHWTAWFNLLTSNRTPILDRTTILQSRTFTPARLII